jgi:hypothetical protein
MSTPASHGNAYQQWATLFAGLSFASLLAGGGLSAGCISINLPDIELPRYSYYQVDSDPQGAHVFMPDGTYKGLTPTTFMLHTKGSFSGEYAIRLVKRGFREKAFKWTARCEKYSESAAKADPYKLLVLLEEELEPAEVSLPPVPPEQRATLAVIDFDVGKEVPEDAGLAAADLCRQALADSQQFKLMDRNHVKSVLGEQDFVAAVHCDSTRCLVQYGKLLHVQRMVHGRIVQLGDEYTLHIGMTDVNTSELLSQVTAVAPQRLEDLRGIVPIKVYDLVTDSVRQQ